MKVCNAENMMALSIYLRVYLTCSTMLLLVIVTLKSLYRGGLEDVVTMQGLCTPIQTVSISFQITHLKSQ